MLNTTTSRLRNIRPRITGREANVDAARLLARIQRRYQTVTAIHEIGCLKLRFTRIQEPDRVLDEAVAEEDLREKIGGARLAAEDLHLPYWAELWDSALGVGQFIVKLRRDEPAEPLAVLDLGCGMGLAGAVAAAVEMDVMLADLEPRALLFASLNTVPFRERARVARIDWRRDRLGEDFDLIIGADVLYDRTQWEFLDRFWQQHLRVAGQVLLGEPGRQTGEIFVKWIRSRGWLLDEFTEPVTTRPTPIRILRLRRA
jgi:predicted nicotinamide N-methyase